MDALNPSYSQTHTQFAPKWMPENKQVILIYIATTTPKQRNVFTIPSLYGTFTYILLYLYKYIYIYVYGKHK